MCGIAGVYGDKEAAKLTYLCLYALQHRGQESAGIASSDGVRMYEHKDMGLVAEIFVKRVLDELRGDRAIGHVRYSTAGGPDRKNIQPFSVDYKGMRIAMVHNGNLTNAVRLRNSLEERGSIFQSSMDSEVIVHLVALSRESLLEDKILDALSKVEGAYSLIFLNGDSMIGVRDPLGFRPLVIGKIGNGFVLASETCALDLIGASFVRDVAPGEMVIINSDGMKSRMFGKSAKCSFCIFEFIYFARPDSTVFGRSVYEMRKGFGKQLARESATDADVVIPVPDSGVPAAIGYAEESGIPFEMGLIRNHYVGRTFIEPESGVRHFGVKVKLNPASGFLKGKRVIVVDDSIVRGTTSKKIVDMIKKAGASEVHMRISSPPTAWPCFYGIDTPTREELVASHLSIPDICKFIGADSLKYLSYEGLYWFAKEFEGEWYCDACFTGKYPTRLIDAEHIENLAKAR